MRFLLYNISYGAGVGARLHFPFPYAGHLKRTVGNLKQIVRFIKRVDPDIIGLVEVDSGSFRSGKGNQAEIIATALNHAHVFESKYGCASRTKMVPVLNKQCNAVLVNRDIEAQRFHYFSDGVKRLVIEVEMKAFTVFLVHLSLKYRHRQHQLYELYHFIRTARKPVIVAGDFNAFSGDRELTLFLAASGLVSANPYGLPSYPSRAPRLQLDYIFHSPEIQTVGFEIPTIRLSDHAPLIWDFTVDGEEEEERPVPADRNEPVVILPPDDQPRQKDTK